MQMNCFLPLVIVCLTWPLSYVLTSKLNLHSTKACDSFVREWFSQRNVILSNTLRTKGECDLVQLKTYDDTMFDSWFLSPQRANAAIYRDAKHKISDRLKRIQQTSPNICSDYYCVQILRKRNTFLPPGALGLKTQLAFLVTAVFFRYFEHLLWVHPTAKHP